MTLSKARSYLNAAPGIPLELVIPNSRNRDAYWRDARRGDNAPKLRVISHDDARRIARELRGDYPYRHHRSYRVLAPREDRAEVWLTDREGAEIWGLTRSFLNKMRLNRPVLTRKKPNHDSAGRPPKQTRIDRAFWREVPSAIKNNQQYDSAEEMKRVLTSYLREQGRDIPWDLACTLPRAA